MAEEVILITQWVFCIASDLSPQLINYPNAALMRSAESHGSKAIS